MMEHACELLAIIEEQQADLHRVRAECVTLRTDLREAMKENNRWVKRIALLEKRQEIIRSALQTDESGLDAVLEIFSK